MIIHPKDQDLFVEHVAGGRRELRMLIRKERVLKDEAGMKEAGR